MYSLTSKRATLNQPNLAKRFSNHRPFHTCAMVLDQVQPSHEWHVTNSRQQQLYVVCYTPASPKALLVFHHGLQEHCRRYDKVFSLLAERGICAVTFDAHGHGRSGPPAANDRALIHEAQHLVDDLLLVVESAYSTLPELHARPPAFVGGHSMGGLVAALAAVQRPDLWQGLLLHSAAVDVEWSTVLRVQAAVGGVMASLIPRARVVPAVRPEDMSQDPRVVQDYVNDPLNLVGNVRAKTGNTLLRAFRSLNKHPERLHVPLYVVHGSNDRCTSMPAAKRLVAAAASIDKAFKEIQGGYHELLHGPEWKGCTADMADWVLAHVPPAGGGMQQMHGTGLTQASSSSSSGGVAQGSRL